MHERVLPLVQAGHLVEVLLLEALNYLMRNFAVPIDWQVPLSAESVLHVLMAFHMDLHRLIILFRFLSLMRAF